MQLGRVVGRAVSSVKHASLNGWRLSLVQLLNAENKADGEPLLVIDPLGASIDSLVILTNDGASTRKLVEHGNSPARWMVMGICDG